jgi:hypothetical protein
MTGKTDPSTLELLEEERQVIPHICSSQKSEVGRQQEHTGDGKPFLKDVQKKGPTVVVHVYNPSSLGGIGGRIMV